MISENIVRKEINNDFQSLSFWCLLTSDINGRILSYKVYSKKFFEIFNIEEGRILNSNIYELLPEKFYLQDNFNKCKKKNHQVQSEILINNYNIIINFIPQVSEDSTQVDIIFQCLNNVTNNAIYNQACCKIAELFTNNHDIDESKINEILKLILKIYSAEACDIYFFNEDFSIANNKYFVNNGNISINTNQTLINSEIEPFLESFKNKKNIIFDAKRLVKNINWINSEDIFSLIFLPLNSFKNKLFGFMGLYFTRNIELNNNELNNLDVLGRLISGYFQIKIGENELKYGEEYFKALLENISDIILILDQDLNVTYVNSAINRNLTYDKNEVIGKSILEFINSKEIEEFKDSFLNLFNNKKLFVPVEFSFWDKRGFWRIFEAIASRLPDTSSPGVIINLRDITERKHVEEALRNSYNFVQTTLDSLSARIAILDESGKILNVNSAWKKFVDEYKFEWNNYGIGSNYLQICQDEFGNSNNVSIVIANGIKDIISKKCSNFNLEYPFIYKNDKNWFSVRIAMFKETEPFRIVVSHQNITERKKIEEALSESENKIRNILNTAPDGILTINENDEILTFNTSAKDMFEYENEEVIGKNFQILMASKQKEDYKGKIEFEDLKNSNKKLLTKSWEFIAKKKNGVIFPVELTVSKNTLNTGNIYTWILRDITERKKSEAKIHNIAKELREFVDTSSSPIFSINIKGKIEDWNNSSETIIGYSKEEVLNKYINSLIIEDKGTLKNVLDKSLETSLSPSSSFELSFKTKDGKKVMILLNITVRKDLEGKISGFWLIGQNVTDLIEYQESLKKKVEERTIELKEALEKEKELSEMKSRFVSMVSHEFRTPLSTILAASALLKKYESKMTEKQKAMRLDKIESEISYMTHMLDNVLLIGKVNANKLKFYPEKINLRDLCTEIIQELSIIHKFELPLINFKYNTNITEVYLDPRLIRHILSNVLSNSIKFSDENDNVYFEITNDEKNIIFKIVDYGIGIPIEEQEKIFEPFYRASNIGNIPGTGLGLAIFKASIDIHGGNFTFKSQISEGSTFIIKIPFINL